MTADNESGRALRSDAERNRQRVLAAARELFAARGLEASLNDVAHHANVGVGTVYRRFATKEELVEAIFEDGIDQIAALAESALQQDDSWTGFVWFVEQLCELTATDRGLREMHLTGTQLNGRAGREYNGRGLRYEDEGRSLPAALSLTPRPAHTLNPWISYH